VDAPRNTTTLAPPRPETYAGDADPRRAGAALAPPRPETLVYLGDTLALEQLVERTAAPSRNLARSVMSQRQRWQFRALGVLWIVCTGFFWSWWLRPGHVGNPALFAIVSAGLVYTVTILPSLYLFYLGQMRRPVHTLAGDAEAVGVIGRVAVVTLTVPGSESIDIVRRQLEAMAAIRYPHDSWVLVDKVHSPEIERLAQSFGVRYFSRHDCDRWGVEQVARWNADGPPFQSKTKAGNVNAWLDAFGQDYTHFTQLDIDHRPNPSYLDRVLGYFKDERVAWVQAPSVYGNLEHWTARGSAEQELVLQGPLQMGFYGFCRTPFIIGSHSTYDTRAIERIGGFQPTRAEDHLDTVFLAADGREGVFVPEIIAVGDGPESFDTYLAQQFAWAYSMMQVLFRFTPRMVRHYTPRQALQFLFVQTWYVLWSMSMLVLFVAPLIALTADTSVSHVGLFEFWAHSLPAALVASGTWFWSRSWHEPRTVRLSWRGVMLHVARWVVVLSAFVQVILRVKKPYMITTKGIAQGTVPRLQLRTLVPYLALVGASLGACWFYLVVHGHSAAQGYLLFAVEGAALFWLLLAVVLTQDLRAVRRLGASAREYGRARWTAWLIFLATSAMLTMTAVASWPSVLAAVAR
jgi:cellulose synthase (UDP-forming)